MSKYSQFNEEEVIESIFKEIGTTNKFFVEIGCLEHGRLSNTYLLKEKGWIGHWFDKDEYPGIIKEFFTKDNINDILTKYNVPTNLDLLSLDVDGNDYWFLKELNFTPRVLVVEFNPRLTGINEYKEDYIWDNRSNQFGASLEEMTKLAVEKGYKVHSSNQTNLFLVYEPSK